MWPHNTIHVCSYVLILGGRQLPLEGLYLLTHPQIGSNTRRCACVRCFPQGACAEEAAASHEQEISTHEEEKNEEKNEGEKKEDELSLTRESEYNSECSSEV